MSETQGVEIEWAQYGERQYKTSTTDERIHYGDPQHDAESHNSDAAERLGYEDRHWRRQLSEDDTTEKQPTAEPTSDTPEMCP